MIIIITRATPKGRPSPVQPRCSLAKANPPAVSSCPSDLGCTQGTPQPICSQNTRFRMPSV